MNSFRFRLTLMMVLLIGLSVLAAGLFIGKTYKDNYLDDLEKSMIREMKVVLATTEWLEAPLEQQYSYFTAEAKRFKSVTGERITFILGDGTVVGDSDHDARSMENHKDRLEISTARQQGEGRDIRTSETTKNNFLYVAIPVRPGQADSPMVRLALSLSEVEASISRMWMVLLLGLLLLFVLAALLCYRIAKGLTQPLEQISGVAKRIKNQDYEARVSGPHKGEIGELGQSINAMADSLQEQMRQIRQNETQLESVLENMINGIVMIDRSGKVVLMNQRAEEVLGISAKDFVGSHYNEAKQQYELARMIQEGLELRQHLKEELTFYFPIERLLELHLVPVFHAGGEFGGALLVVQDVSAIRRLERMRSEFVANVSHELKTPIAAVKGFAETLLGGAVDDPEISRSFLQIIFDESERLNRLIGDILELSKVESRRIPLQFSPIEMSSFVAKAVEVISAEAAKKRIVLEMKVEEGIYVEADEDRLLQILMNLLSNGINYTPEGGKVSVAVEPMYKKQAGRKTGEQDYDHIRIRITDTGIGIPKKDLPRIFERFYRVDKARSRSSGGTGLGLSIVKHLVELHKGSITVDSVVGVGSTFSIELPVLH